MPARASAMFIPFLVWLGPGAFAVNPAFDSDPDTKNSETIPLYVRADAPPGGDGTSWGNAFSTIGDALVVAATGDEVWIAGGTYRESLDLNLPLTLRGGLDPLLSADPVPVASATPTVIDASGLGSSVITIFSASEARLSGLTLTGGYAPLGGGVFSEFARKVEIHNCRILNNTATQRGGGLYVIGPEFTLADSLVQGNVAEGTRTESGGSSSILEGIGGGVHLRSALQVLLTNSTFRENRSGAGGSGLEIATSSGAAITVRDCTFTANSGDFSGARCGPIRLADEVFALFERAALFENRMDRLPHSISLNGAILGDPLSAAELIDCAISNNSGMSGILLDGVDLENCRIVGNAGSGVVGLRVVAASTLVSGNGQRGVSSRRGGSFTDSLFSANGRTGLELVGQAADEILIERCEILGNGAVALTQPSLSVTGGLSIQGGSATVSDSAISGNRGGGFSSGGADLSNLSARFRNTRIEGNTSQTGSGAGQFRDSEVSLDQCAVQGNSTLQVAFTGANGIASKRSSGSPLPSTLILTNSVVAGNSGFGRGGVYVEGGALSIFNSTIQGNRVQGSSAGELRVLNSIVSSGAGGLESIGFSPVDVRYSNVGEPFPGEGNLSSDPLFFHPWDGQRADLRLRCESLSVDAGTEEGAPPIDIVGTLRPRGGGVDMGAYENCLRDFNGDRLEDGLDLLYFPTQWYRPVDSSNLPFDLAPAPPPPSRIDSRDLIELLEGDLTF